MLVILQEPCSLEDFVPSKYIAAPILLLVCTAVCVYNCRQVAYTLLKFASCHFKDYSVPMDMNTIMS